jgi:hypothetical protein
MHDGQTKSASKDLPFGATASRVENHTCRSSHDAVKYTAGRGPFDQQHGAWAESGDLVTERGPALVRFLGVDHVGTHHYQVHAALRGVTDDFGATTPVDDLASTLPCGSH